VLLRDGSSNSSDSIMPDGQPRTPITPHACSTTAPAEAETMAPPTEKAEIVASSAEVMRMPVRKALDALTTPATRGNNGPGYGLLIFVLILGVLSGSAATAWSLSHPDDASADRSVKEPQTARIACAPLRVQAGERIACEVTARDDEGQLLTALPLNVSVVAIVTSSVHRVASVDLKVAASIERARQSPHFDVIASTTGLGQASMALPNGQTLATSDEFTVVPGPAAASATGLICSGLRGATEPIIAGEMVQCQLHYHDRFGNAAAEPPVETAIVRTLGAAVEPIQPHELMGVHGVCGFSTSSPGRAGLELRMGDHPPVEVWVNVVPRYHRT